MNGKFNEELNDQLKSSRRTFIKNTVALGALSMVGGCATGPSPGLTSDGTGYVEPLKAIPVYGKFDVIVVGGGPAGWAAALASARNKAKTLIIERFPFFGGTATASLMLNINGYRNQVKPDGLQTSRGIAEELILELKAMKGLGSRTSYPAQEYTTTKGDMSYSYPIDSEKTKYIMLKMLCDAGVNILFHTMFVNTIMEGNNVTGVIVENKSGRQAIFGKVVVDASGDADVAYHAGVDYWQAKPDDNQLHNCIMYKVTMSPQATREARGVVINNDQLLWGPTAEFNGANGDALTQGEIKMRLAVFDHFRRNQERRAPLWDDAYVQEVAPLGGIRQTRFILGLYTTTNDDALAGNRFDDSIAMSACPIIHYHGYRRYLEHTGYEIPYRCLVPEKKIEGLLVTGRCMSSDQQSYESWRAMAPVMSLGEATGVAAAICVETNKSPRDVDVARVRETLIRQGSEVGQNNKHTPNPALIQSVSPSSTPPRT